MSRDQDVKTARWFLGLFPTLNNLQKSEGKDSFSPCLYGPRSIPSPGLKQTLTQSSETKAEPSLFLWLMLSSRRTTTRGLNQAPSLS